MVVLSGNFPYIHQHGFMLNVKMSKLERNCEILRLLVPRYYIGNVVMPSNDRDT